MDNLNGDVGLMITSHLTSVETSKVRAASRGCASVFRRNCPVNGAFLYLEQFAMPNLVHYSLTVRFEKRSIVPHGPPEKSQTNLEACEQPRANFLSPYRCWKLDPRWAGALTRSEDPAHRRFAARLFKDREFVLSAIQAGVTDVLEFTDKTLRGDRDILLAAVTVDGMALEHASDAVKADRGVVFAAVQQDGWALKFANDIFRIDKPLVIAAVRQNPKTHLLADVSLRCDPDVRRAAGLDILPATATVFGGSNTYYERKALAHPPASSSGRSSSAERRHLFASGRFVSDAVARIGRAFTFSSSNQDLLVSTT